MVDFLPYPFLIAEFRDKTYYVIYANQKFLEEIGYTCAEIPTIHDWFNRAYPDTSYREGVVMEWNDRVNQAKIEGKDYVMMKVSIHTKKGEDVWYEVKSSLSDKIQLVAFVNIQEGIEKEKELKRLNENKNHTLSILTHDLRTPIASLHSLAQLAMSADLSHEEFVVLTKALHDKSQQVIDLLDTTLLWTKSNFDKIVVKIQKVNLPEVIKKILALYESSYESKRIRITLDLNGTWPTSDTGIITIVIRNLLSNAIKFTAEEGQITIRSYQEGNACMISVQDSGTGMSEETVNKIMADQFNPSGGAHKEKGYGIGLQLCRQLLEKVEGRMEIESEIGKGTLVKILL